MSTLKTNTIKNTDDVEMYLAKAWVNFNGTGTVAIRAAGNVSSITDNGTGDYTVNFTISMPDANYSAITDCGFSTTNPSTVFSTSVPVDSGSLRIDCNSTSGVATDREFVTATIFR